MALQTNDADQCGQTNGTTLTLGNSAGGTNTALTSVTGTWTFDGTAPPIGVQDFKCAALTAAKGYLQLSSTSATSAAGRMYFTLTGLPSAPIQWLGLGASGANYIGLKNTGVLYVQTSGAVAYTSTLVLSLNTLYRVEFGMTVGLSGATVNFGLYAGSSTTALDSFTSAAQNTGSTNPGSVLMGKGSTAANIAIFYLGGLAANIGSSALIGPAPIPRTAAGTIAFAGSGIAADSIYPATILVDQPLAYYRLDESSGTTLVDLSGNGHNGTYSGGYSLGATGLVGSADTAVTLLGNATLATTYASWMNTTAETAECWIQTTTTTGIHGLINRDDGTNRNYQFRLNGTSIEFITINGGAGVVTATVTSAGVTDGHPHHIVATYDATNIKIYVDGSLVNTTAAAGALSTNSPDLIIGNYFLNTYPFTGVMDEVALYGYALTAAQVTAHYTAGIAASVAATAAGTITFAGTATAVGAAAAAGAVAFTGTASPAATASAAGTVTFTGSGTARAPAASSGAVAFAGTATGTAAATSAGTATFTGASTAAAATTAAGSATFTGTATPGGSAPATASGTITFAGTATARGAATAAGTVTFTGLGTPGGSGTPATASGTITFTGMATASAAATATGTVTFGGAGTAAATTTTAGTITVTGTGTAGAAASSTGTVTFTGLSTARGATTATGIITFTGTATSSSGLEDLRLTITAAASNWTTTEAASRWVTTPGTPNWTTTEAPSRWATTPGAPNWTTTEAP